MRFIQLLPQAAILTAVLVASIVFSGKVLAEENPEATPPTPGSYQMPYARDLKDLAPGGPAKGAYWFFFQQRPQPGPRQLLLCVRLQDQTATCAPFHRIQGLTHFRRTNTGDHVTSGE